MQKMELTIFKLNQDIKFPYQKAEVNLGSLSRKVNFGEFIGLVYTDKDRSIRKIGVLCKVIGKINQIYLVNNQSYPVTICRLDVLFRVRILDDSKNADRSSEYFTGTVELIEDEIIPQEMKQKIEKENLFEKLKSEANKFFVLNRINIELGRTQYNYVKFVFLLPGFLRLSGEEKQNFLEIENLYDRIKFMIEYFSNVNKTILTQNNEQIAKRNELPGKADKTGPNQYNLNLGNNSNKFSGFGGNSRGENLIREFEEKIAKINLPDEARKIALDEIERLKSSKNTPDYEWTVTYLNTLLALPWDTVTVDSDSITRTQEILDRDHFGLEKVKKRIIEYLSVRKLVKASFEEYMEDNNNVEIKKDDNDHLSTKSADKGVKDPQTTKTNPPSKPKSSPTHHIKSGSILCFNGPPGVGKTSLAKSIADSLNKKFYRLSLGGLKEVAEINGHRRTFVASMPGMIIQALKRIQSKNPVILLDEIDKVGLNIKGDVASALLEVLDPEQNQTFKDHYLNTPFDLSQVFFICTSNYLENISPPLRDRLEIINISGYSPLEKTQICQKYLIPKQIRVNGLNSDVIKIKVDIEDKVVNDIILNYTFESGVRQLDRSVAAICRKIAKDAVEEMEKGKNDLKMDEITNSLVEKEIENLTLNSDTSKNQSEYKDKDPKIKKVRVKFMKDIKVTEKMLEEILGKKRKEVDLELRLTSPGVAIGLAYTLNGGSLTLIESSVFNGNGATILTGNMGDIMEESIYTAVSWIKANQNLLGLNNIDFSKKDVHIHVPDAAVPKDGPSAGITITISLVSLLTGNPVRRDTAMSGEITLQGYVLPVGGIKEKCFAALRNNIKRIILSVQNKDDVEELPKEIKNEVKFIFVKDIKEVIQNAFHDININKENKTVEFGNLRAAKF